MQKRSSKSESTRKNWARQVLLKNFDFSQSQRSKSTVNYLVKVNSQLLTCADVEVWCHPKADVAVRETEQARGVRGSACGTWGWRVRRVRDTDGEWQRVEARKEHAREAETSAGAWRRMWCIFWPFLVGFFSGLVVLSLYAFALAVGWAEWWYPRVAGTVGVTAVTRFWQWLLDEGEGSRRTSEMSTGTRKSKEWLWYHINNIKWKRKTE